ncbi:bacteriocin family protein [bacterium]|nr:bacteriocin family protein [bacterium]
MASDILRRSFAPVASEAWAEIDVRAKEIFQTSLTLRSIVDFSGPHGWEFAALNLGRLDVTGKKPVDGVTWGLRQVMPAVETRIPFSLKQMDLDSVTRGSKNPDLGPLEEAARKAAFFEENCLYNGFKAGGIPGLFPSAEQPAVALPGSMEDMPKAAAQAVQAIQGAGIPGPYTLVLAPAQYQALMQAAKGGFPIHRAVREILGGGILWSSALSGGVILSVRGGDFELAVGQDLSIGYWRHDGDSVDFYITESFTFRVIEPAAFVPLKGAK